MTIDVIKDIKEVEAEAEQIVRQSQNSARQKVADAQAESSRIIEQAESDAQKEAEEMIREAESRAEEEISKIKIQVSMECADVKDAANKKFPEAIDIITGRIVKFNVDS